MYKLWAKIIDDNRKMKKDAIISREGTLNCDTFFDDLTELCQKLDVSVPCVLKYHIDSLEKFSFVKFLPRDFMEKVDFAAMTVEYSFEMTVKRN